jgi:hypothetical protein
MFKFHPEIAQRWAKEMHSKGQSMDNEALANTAARLRSKRLRGNKAQQAYAAKTGNSSLRIGDKRIQYFGGPGGFNPQIGRKTPRGGELPATAAHVPVRRGRNLTPGVPRKSVNPRVAAMQRAREAAKANRPNKQTPPRSNPQMPRNFMAYKSARGLLQQTKDRNKPDNKDELRRLIAGKKLRALKYRKFGRARRRKPSTPRED